MFTTIGAVLLYDAGAYRARGAQMQIKTNAIYDSKEGVEES